MLKKVLLLLFTFSLFASPITAAQMEYIYKGDSTNKEDILFTYTHNKFYLGEGTKSEPILTHSSFIVYEGNTTQDLLWRMNEGKLHKGSAFARADCVATIIDNKIYSGYVMNIEDVINDTPLFTLEGNKIYKGAEITPENCLLTFSGILSDNKLVFIAYELSQPKYQLELSQQ